MSTALLSALFLLLTPGVLAAGGHVHGGSETMPGVTMVPYLHFTPGDAVWFLEWVPRTPGAIGGTCVGLFILAIVERWLKACRAMMELHWAHRTRLAQAKKDDSVTTKQSPTVADALLLRRASPFIWSHDIARGLIHMVQTALDFAFMLVVMTYQVSFIAAVVIGLGTGEVMFGRYIHHL